MAKIESGSLRYYQADAYELVEIRDRGSRHWRLGQKDRTDGLTFYGQHLRALRDLLDAALGDGPRGQ